MTKIMIVAVVLALAGVGQAYNNGLGRLPPMGWNVSAQRVDATRRGLTIGSHLRRSSPYIFLFFNLPLCLARHGLRLAGTASM